MQTECKYGGFTTEQFTCIYFVLLWRSIATAQCMGLRQKMAGVDFERVYRRNRVRKYKEVFE